MSLIITPFGIFTAIGFILASFLFWRSLRDDFPQEEILTLTLYLALGGLLSARFFWVLFHWQLFWQEPLALILWSKIPGFSFLGTTLGILGTLGYWGRKKVWDLWQALDSLIVACLVFFVFGAAGAYLTNKDFFYLLLGFLGIFILILIKFVFKNYRSFSFYKSGKVGFIGLSSLACFFSLFLPLAFFKKSVLSLEMVGFLVIIFGALGLLYQRSGRKIGEDIKKFKIYAKSNFPNQISS